MHRSIIIGSGAAIPPIVIRNSDFLSNEFYSANGLRAESTPDRIIEKFAKITGILERRYVSQDVSASDLASEAAAKAISDSAIDKESLDLIIVAHNFGDMKKGLPSPNLVPSLGSKVKRQLGISNPSCVPYDLVFGCAGWLQGMIHADAFFKAGMAKTALIIGTDTLSRVLDPHDRDSMIFSDGAGAIVLCYEKVNDQATGLLSAKVRSDAGEETDYIQMAGSQCPEEPLDAQYLKMKGRKVYEYALRYVPGAMKECLDNSGYSIERLQAIFIHQANEKMNEAIVKAFYALYGIGEPPENVMPMCIQWLGNSSVATIPTLFDLVRKSSLPGYELKTGDLVLFASVGAGMNINAVCYGCP
jgi:3-oxoacyl-[acyl-carrier-protein] synthase-3